MMKSLGLAAWLALACLAAGQPEPAVPRSQVAGTVTSVNPEKNQLSIKSDKGDALDVATTDRTVVLRIPPGETDPKKGSKIALASVTAGDRAVIVGPAPSGNTWSATAVLVMTKSDVASIHQKEHEDWKKRGVTGTVTAIDPASKTITIKSGAHTVAVKPSEKTSWHRYSADSARFDNAKPSGISEVKPGDQLRVLGNKGEDEASIQAEKIVFGSFRQIAATITSIDAAKGELTVKDLATKKPLMAKVDSDSTMKKLPEQVARTLARRYAPGAQSNPQPPAGGRGGGDVGQMLDALPAMPLSELKPGDAIMLSTTQGTDPGRATVITLLAGVEPLLTASPTATRDIMSGWNLASGGDTGQ